MKLLSIGLLGFLLTSFPVLADVTIYMTNSGQTLWDIEYKCLTYTDQELHEEGIKQASELGKKLAEQGILFDGYISSDLKRAQQTCNIIKQSLKDEEKKTIVSEKLQPRTLGKEKKKDWEGKELIDLGNHLKQNNMSIENMSPEEYFNFTMNGEIDESFSDEYNRVSSYLAQLASDYKEKTLLVATHTSVIRSILLYEFIVNNKIEKIPTQKISPDAYLVLKVSEEGTITLIEKNRIEIH